MDEALDAGLARQSRQPGRRHMVQQIEALAAALMQDADQVDDRVLGARQALEHRLIADIRFHHVDGGQHDQVLGALTAARGHGDLDFAARELSDEMAADEA